jgi:hypothetical protein
MMKHASNHRLGILALGVLLSAIGCQRAEKGGGGDDAAPPPAGGSVAAAQTIAGGKAVCVATSSWAICNVLDRLGRAGLAVRQDTEMVVAEAPLTERGIMLHVGRAELEVFLYPDERARLADEQRLDAAQFVRATMPLTMRRERTLISSANLLGILKSLNDQQRERVSDALMAGPPQRAPAP